MNQIVKEFSFGDEGKDKVFKGIEVLTKAVASTLGGGGECVIFEDAHGIPVYNKRRCNCRRAKCSVRSCRKYGSLVSKASSKTELCKKPETELQQLPY